MPSCSVESCVCVPSIASFIEVHATFGMDMYTILRSSNTKYSVGIYAPCCSRFFPLTRKVLNAGIFYSDSAALL